MDFENPPREPLGQVEAWLADADETGLTNPRAMTLATVDPDGRPSARTVLLKGLDARGAVFFTNENSRKGRALAANPNVTLLFHWDALARQIVIEGEAARVDAADADRYFATRPRGAQIGAGASEQSAPIASRRVLEERVVEVATRYAGRDVPRPPHWNGYRVALERVELWQGRESRLHDRIVYTRQGDGWTVTRLSP